ncbi:MAG: COX15/CtaA family protein [Actinomycetota bacterium]
MRIGPTTYRRAVAVAWFALAAIVVTGSAVRLTQSGLGCEDWPGCSEDRFIPEQDFHGAIEFGNRAFSGVVALAVAVAVLTAYRRVPRRNDLLPWAWGLAAVVVAQIFLGLFTVIGDLHPFLVGSHFLLSMVTLWNAAVLWDKASAGPGVARPLFPPSVIWHGRALVAQGAAILVVGTLVTGTGPNSGDSRAERLQFDLEAITRVHSVMVWCFLAIAAALAIRLGRTGRTPPHLQWLLAAIVAQGALGYWQFAVGVPPLLVGLHVIGSMVVWCLAVLTHLQLFQRPNEEFDLEGVNDEPSLAKMTL